MDDLRIRVASLEIHVENIRSDIREIKSDIRAFLDTSRQIEGRLSTVEAELNHKPTMKAMWATAGSIIVAVGAFIVFQAHLQRLLGIVLAP